MKTNTLLNLTLLLSLFGGIRLWGQEKGESHPLLPPPNTQEKVKTPHPRSWEIGVGGTLANWNRIALTRFQAVNKAYTYDIQAHHVMAGPSLYIAHEITPWFYLDLQGSISFAKNKSQNRYDKLYLGGIGSELRLGYLIGARWSDPYIRLGVNYLYKDFLATYNGTFDVTNATPAAHKAGNQATWATSDIWNPSGRMMDKNSFFPLSLGAGVKSWFTDNLGVGLQAEYMLPLSRALPRFAQVTAQLIWRIGGNTKEKAPVVKYVQVPVEKIVERVVEKIVEKPIPANPTTIERQICDLMDHITFAFDKADLTKESEKTLDQLAEVLRQHPNDHFLILGYTDARGSVKYNLDLSKRRARAVYRALLKRAVAPESLKWRGIGKGASLIRPSKSHQVRHGDRKVVIERVTNIDYWNAL